VYFFRFKNIFCRQLIHIILLSLHFNVYLQSKDFFRHHHLVVQQLKTMPHARKSHDDEDCDACEAMGSIQSTLADLMANANLMKPQEPPKKPQSTQASKKPTQNTSQDEYWEPREPPDIIELGNAGWTLLHTIAAYYPNKPTEEKKRQTAQFLQSMSQVMRIVINHLNNHF
jgi:hypothetical protein